MELIEKLAHMCAISCIAVVKRGVVDPVKTELVTLNIEETDGQSNPDQSGMSCQKKESN